MEFFRRWGIADRVREAGTPGDFPHTVLYLTALTGFEIARFERPDHAIVYGRNPLHELIIAGHFSTRYHPNEVRKLLDNKLPPELKAKLKVWV